MSTACAFNVPDYVPARSGIDLFEWAGVPLSPTDEARRDATETDGWSSVPGTNLKVWARPDGSPFGRPREPIQLVLAFPVSSAERLISPRYSVFMSATLRSVLRANTRQIAAATHLMRRDILYVGDIAKMSAFELAGWLGPYVGAYDEIQAALAEVGLCNGGLARWWRRPHDYYAQAL